MIYHAKAHHVQQLENMYILKNLDNVSVRGTGVCHPQSETIGPSSSVLSMLPHSSFLRFPTGFYLEMLGLKLGPSSCKTAALRLIILDLIGLRVRVHLP